MKVWSHYWFIIVPSSVVESVVCSSRSVDDVLQSPTNCFPLTLIQFPEQVWKEIKAIEDRSETKVWKAAEVHRALEDRPALKVCAQDFVST